jgi:L-histidine N-alpha-methyltransferase
MKTAYDAERFEIIDWTADSAHEHMKQEVREGLTAERKYLPSKYFYDSRGSVLFEQICQLPEYYPTRTELSILKKIAPAVMKELKEGSLIELGSGANWKVRHLLDAADGSRGKIRYIAVDVCESTLVGSTEELLCLYPDLCVTAIVADFHRKLGNIGATGSKLLTFFGSTIGNFSNEESDAFLRSIAALMKPKDRFLVGLDLAKRKQTLEEAYNDGTGITAQFNKNILSVINRELNSDFNPSSFNHLAFYNETSQCIEMHLEANEDVSIEIADLELEVSLKQGETILTEISRKYEREGVERMASQAGLRIKRWYSDRKEWFALVELVKKN